MKHDLYAIYYYFCCAQIEVKIKRSKIIDRLFGPKYKWMPFYEALKSGCLERDSWHWEAQSDGGLIWLKRYLV